MAQLGKCARATPRQAAGRLARGSANLGLESGLTERRTLLALGGLQSAPFGHVAAWEVWNQTPRQPAGHYGKWPNWANALGQPPARLRGGCAGDPQALAWGLDARKGAVWAEGLAEGAPWAKPGHHQAASRS